MINLADLPQETRDRLELKEELDPTFERALEIDYTDIFFQTMDERKDLSREHSYLSSIYGQQGQGKSYTALFCCGYLDPNFNIDQIYFDYNELVYNKHKLKPHTAILVDEQTRQYGIDSMRISSVLNALKEQLRKKSIHMFYCSPTLKDEYLTSMYVMETMFTDREFNENYLAYKTNQLHCLGYIIVPHPLKSISKSLLLEYEKKKDKHLEELTEKPVDEVEERVKTICNNAFFKKAEKIYIEQKGYIPSKLVVQIINKLFPEFKSSAIVFELADRIRLNKETSGEWESAR